MRHGKVVFAWVFRGVQGRVVAEAGESHGRENADDVGVVREIEV